MDNYAQATKGKLMAIITDMASRKEEFVKIPGKDFTRKRKLSFEDTILMMLSMGGGSLNKELLEYFDYNPNVATSSAFIQQRDKLLIETFKYLLHEFTHSTEDLKSYHGYRLLAVDGSDLIIPHDPNNKKTYFRQNYTRKGYNLLHLNAMYDLCNKVYVDGCVQSSRDIGEIKALNNMVDDSLLKDENVIVIADRGYESYNTFAHIEQKGWKYLIRVKDIESNGIVAALDLPMTGEFDEQFSRTLTRKKGVEFRHRSDLYKVIHYSTVFDYLESIGKVYYPMCFRIVRVKLAKDNYHTFITNLDPEVFGMKQIKEIYRMRWGIETSFRELKHTLGLASLHSKKIACMMQEVFAKMIMYNFCEIITLHVVILQKPRKHTYQVNFSMAMSICRHFFRAFEHAQLSNVEALIQKFILPVRPDRKYPRKIKSKTFVSFTYRLA